MFYITYALRSSSIFPCIMTISLALRYSLSFTYLFPNLFYKYNRFLHFHLILAALLLITSFFFLKLIMFITSSVKHSQNFFIHHTYFQSFSTMILQTLKNLIEYVNLLLLWMNIKDYLYIHQSFLLDFQYLHK